jgi:hypothetical protein
MEFSEPTTFFYLEITQMHLDINQGTDCIGEFSMMFLKFEFYRTALSSL